jgi:hypothetical protein
MFILPKANNHIDVRIYVEFVGRGTLTYGVYVSTEFQILKSSGSDLRTVAGSIRQKERIRIHFQWNMFH